MSKKTVKAQLPGTFYHQSSPEAKPYKKAGDQVNVGDTVGIIEVMKSFYEVTSDISGKFVSYIVENEGEVISGQDVVEIES